MNNYNKIASLCLEKGINLTEQRQIIVQALADSEDHPDVDIIYQRAVQLVKEHQRDIKISIATVYRTVKLLEETGIIERHDFDGLKSRYEVVTEQHHDHIVNIDNGKIIEFQNADIERIQLKIAQELGYELVDHRLVLYCRPKRNS